MTILDTFYLLFKTDIPKEAGADISKLDKQLDDLAKKGKKRTEDENKQYDALKKRRKELLDDTKQQQRETEKLKDSFTGMIEGAVGAATAYVTFGALKSGLMDANRLNASLAILGKTTGQNAGEVKAYGAALEQAGGNAQDLYAFVGAQANYAAQHRTPFEFKRLIENLHNQVKNKSPQEALTLLQQVPGAVALAPLLESSDAEFHAALEGGKDSARLSDRDAEAALKNQEAYAKTRQAFQSIATEIDTHLLRTIGSLNDALLGLADTFKGHPLAAEAAGTTAAVTTGYFGWKSLGWLKNLIGGGSAAAEAGEAAAATAGGVSAAAIAAAAAAGVSATWGAGWVGDKIGKWAKGGGPSSKSAGGPNKQESIAFWQSQGYSPAQAAAWAANEQAESSYNPRATNGSHAGIFQWSSSRRAKLLAATGIDVLTASHADQLKAAAWEARQMGLGPLGLPDSSAGAAATISNKFEVPSTNPLGLLMEAQKRAKIASNIDRTIPSIGAGAGNAGKTVNVKIDDITVHTQATDAAGIAQGVSDELKSHLRMLASNVDDGELGLMARTTPTSIASDISYGLGLLSSFGPKIDVVGIYGNGGTAESDFSQMFAAARPMKATVRETSRIMEHPVETGVVLADHHVINPVEIDLPLIIGAGDYAQTFSQIRQAFVNATALSIKTRVGIYSDMIIADMPHEEEPDMYDVITVGLHLKQVIYVVPAANGGTLVNFRPIDPLNSNTTASGLQSAVSLAGSGLSAATSLASYAHLGKFL